MESHETVSARSPNLEHLRTQAKQTALPSSAPGDLAAARTFIETLPAASDDAGESTTRRIRLADAQSAIARQSASPRGPISPATSNNCRLRGRNGIRVAEVDGHAMPGRWRPIAHADGRRPVPHGVPERPTKGVVCARRRGRPAHIDIESSKDLKPATWSYGIYRFDGDDLVLCLGLTGAPRPTQFATTSGSGHALERLRRSSPARPAHRDRRRAQRLGVHDAAVGTQPSSTRTAFALAMTPLLERLNRGMGTGALVEDGSRWPTRISRTGLRTLTGNETKVCSAGQVMVHAKIRIDEAQTPIAVDYVNVDEAPRPSRSAS